MKPLVYFDFESFSDKDVIIGKERLQEILEEVYQAGYEDGKNSKSYIITTPYITPTFTCDAND